MYLLARAFLGLDNNKKNRSRADILSKKKNAAEMAAFFGAKR